MSEKSDRYIGELRIVSEKELDQKTPLGQKVFKVQLEDGTSEVLTEKTLKNLVTDEPLENKDMAEGGPVINQLREKKVRPIAYEILLLMREANLKLGEIDYCLSTAANMVNTELTQAENRLWNVRYPEERSLLMVQDVLESNIISGDEDTSGKN